jgi:DNA-binding CsgD family transcriptional regulator
MTLRPVSQDPISACTLDLADSLGYGGFLLDLSGRVLSFNLLALSCLRDGLRLVGEHLSAVDRNTDRRLQHLVSVALRWDDPQVPAPVAVQRLARLPLIIRTLRLEQQGQQSRRSPRAIILVLDPELWPKPRRDLLAQAFELTPTESDVAIGIASGGTVAQVAAWRHVKIGTVRAHLKTVFSKTHTHGQADLTRVLTRLAFLTPQIELEVPPTRSVA